MTDQPIDPNMSEYIPVPTPMNSIPELGPRMSAGFSEAHYQFLTQLIESKSAREIFLKVTQSAFSAQCINAFYKLITAQFDKNTMLAKNNQTQIKMRCLDFDIALNLLVLECHESDIQNPEFLTTCENLRHMFKDFVSRSATERDQLLRQEFGGFQQNPPQQSQHQGSAFIPRVPGVGRPQ